MNGVRQFIIRQGWKKFFLCVLLICFSINIIQSIFMEIMSDEAYYALYGENLAWGYFDHPPMVGLSIWLSSLFFDGNLSVRFMTVVFNILTLVLIWKLLGEEKPDVRKVTLFFILAASMIMFTVYGFVTAPDVPFLFFTALFLLGYKRFLEKESWLDTFLLCVAMAGMIYSKYHAVLVIGFIVLSNLKLLTRYKAWLAVLLAAALLLPHLKWQMDMDFLSVSYHIGVRSRKFKLSYFLEYLPNQLGVFNPLVLGAMVYVVVKYRAGDVFERGLYFMIIGFFFFFWAMTFRGHVGPHWTVAATIPMIILLYRRSLDDPKLKRFVVKWLAPTILLILVARLALIFGLLPEQLGFSGKREKHEATRSVVGDLPVAYVSSFQKPSNYHFFTGGEAFTLSNAVNRRTQFDLWQKELDYQGKSVFIFQ
ncbi:MAG: glycosyltransferase family 39 protein, partial [Prolixibacteraceae bacterium]|nr:glycosyltransferase family 39 protein [Prolixibacteraceae bacterium]